MHYLPTGRFLATMTALLAACAGETGPSTAGAPVDGGATGQPPPGHGAVADGGGGGDGATTQDGAPSEGDPNLDGPFAHAEKDASMKVAATGDTVAVHVAYPTGTGSFPVVVLGHGFQLAPSQYYGYLERLASFGYVAMTVDFPAGLAGSDNPAQAEDLLAALDWAKADPTFGANVDATTAGTTGHSLGGKIALLAATMDPRVKAVIALDPVDAGGPTGCNPPACANVASLMPTLAIPTSFLGETTDATGTFQACAPAASNFETFYSKAKTPSMQVTLAGANHMSFLDDVSACGVGCGFCNAATAPNAQINATARAFVVAFFERHLRGKTAYDAYLTGAQAQARYVATAQAAIVWK